MIFFWIVFLIFSIERYFYLKQEYRNIKNIFGRSIVQQVVRRSSYLILFAIAYPSFLLYYIFIDNHDSIFLFLLLYWTSSFLYRFIFLIYCRIHKPKLGTVLIYLTEITKAKDIVNIVSSIVMFFLNCGAILYFFIILNRLATNPNNFDWHHLYQYISILLKTIVVFLGMFFIAFICLGSIQPEIRERGILFPFYFIEWEKIKLYRWVDEEKSFWQEAKSDVLYIYFESKWKFINPLWRYQIPVNKIERLRQVLSEYLPAECEVKR